MTLGITGGQASTPQKGIITRNAANVVSIVGVLPLCILFSDSGYQYLLPLIIYNNIMDDLDGALAKRLDIRSKFGAMMDNVCDTVSHTVLALVIGMHYFAQADNVIIGGLLVTGSLLATAAIILRSVSRMDPERPKAGSPTNELIRHLFLVILLSQIFDFDPTLFLMAIFPLHAFTMLAPLQMQYLIRSLTKSEVAIILLNASLILSWWVPLFAPVIAASFIGSYFYSLVAGAFRSYRSARSG